MRSCGKVVILIWLYQEVMTDRSILSYPTIICSEHIRNRDYSTTFASYFQGLTLVFMYPCTVDINLSLGLDDAHKCWPGRSQVGLSVTRQKSTNPRCLLMQHFLIVTLYVRPFLNHSIKGTCPVDLKADNNAIVTLQNVSNSRKLMVFNGYKSTWEIFHDSELCMCKKQIIISSGHQTTKTWWFFEIDQANSFRSMNPKHLILYTIPSVSGRSMTWSIMMLKCIQGDSQHQCLNSLCTVHAITSPLLHGVLIQTSCFDCKGAWWW